jgi:hypothetical protein
VLRSEFSAITCTLRPQNPAARGVIHGQVADGHKIAHVAAVAVDRETLADWLRTGRLTAMRIIDLWGRA